LPWEPRLTSFPGQTDSGTSVLDTLKPSRMRKGLSTVGPTTLMIGALPAAVILRVALAPTVAGEKALRAAAEMT
jgi:hypothetical protein